MAGIDPFIAEICIFPFNFAPRGWSFCDGKLLELSQNTALFSLLGTTYGGNGQTTFALPDLQGRVPMHPGQGPGLSVHYLGEQGGERAVTLIESEIPAHSHTAGDFKYPIATAADTDNPSQAYFANVPGVQLYSSDKMAGNSNVKIYPSPVGGGLPHNNLMPYLTLNFCIALQGVFPSRS